jgi:DNA-directed RNA polymerase
MCRLENNSLAGELVRFDESGGPWMDEALPIELQLADDKARKKYERTMADIGWGATEAGLKLSQRYLPRVTDAVLSALGEDNHRELASLIRELEPEVIALCALQNALHSVARSDSLLETSLLMGNALAGECWAAGLTADQPKLAAGIVKRAKERHGSLRHRKQAVRSAAKRAGYRTKLWARDLVATAGGWCLDVVLQALPEVFCVVEDGKGGKELTVAEGALELAHAAAAEVVDRSPVYQPQVEPPVPWTWLDKGGPSDPRVLRTLLRRTDKHTMAAVRAAIKDGSMQPTLDALNALQAVPWRINRRVLGVLQGLRERGLSVPGMPGQDIATPEHGPWEELSEDEQRAWRIRAAQVATANRGLIGDHMLFAQDMSTAEKLAEAERFYTPMNLDWRGRVYGMCHFNFQREDRVRALFEFADGEPIGEEGLYWLKVHVANCGAFDKIDKRPFEESVQWVNANLEKIEAGPALSTSSRIVVDPSGQSVSVLGGVPGAGFSKLRSARNT